MDEGGSRRFDHFTVVDNLVNESFPLAGGGVEAVLTDFPDKLFWRGIIGVYKGFTSGHYNDQLFLINIV